MNAHSIRDASRRSFLRFTASLAAAPLAGYPRPGSAETPSETTRIRLIRNVGICLAPQYVAEELLRLEGFKEIHYVDTGDEPGGALLASGRVDLTMWDIPSLILPLAAGEPILLLAGIHAGCYELIANDRVRSIRDLKGRTVAISAYWDSDHVLLSSMLAYVGIDPGTDVKWVVNAETPADLFIDGKADAIMGFPPQPQELRRRKIGHVIVNTAQDRPWSQYFCCALAGNRDFVRAHPVATKRALRAILKAADFCAREPEQAARYMADKGFESRYDIGLEVLKDVQYLRWRDGDPEDTLRFHALRLYEVGMIKTNPQKLIAQGTDWRFLKELKRELRS